MGGGGSDQHDEHGCGVGLRFLTREHLEALATAPSGLSRVSIQEWAVLLRCRSGEAVPADELVASLIDWFAAPMSAGEISEVITRLADEGFLARVDNGAAYQTTRLGHEVLDETQQPLVKGALWLLGKKDDEGDAHVDR